MSILLNVYSLDSLLVSPDPNQPTAPAKPDTRAEGLAFQASTGYLLGRIGAVAYQRWVEVAARLDVTPTQAKVLMALGEVGPVGQQRLAELVGVDPRNAVPVVEALVEMGLVSRQVDPSDRRRRLLDLTNDGRRLAHELTSITAQNDEQLLTSLSPAERSRLRRMLRAVLDASTETRGA